MRRKLSSQTYGVSPGNLENVQYTNHRDNAKQIPMNTAALRLVNIAIYYHGNITLWERWESERYHTYSLVFSLLFRVVLVGMD